MKLSILAAAFALALAGAASAQQGAYAPGPGGSVIPQGTSPGETSQSFATVGSRDTAYSPSPRAIAAGKAARATYRLACVPDRQTTCVGRVSDGAVWECLKVHRSQLTSPWRAATYQLEQSRQGAL